MNNIEIDSRLILDSQFLLELSLCQLRIKKEMELPWIILIPLRKNMKEVFELPEFDRHLLMEEISLSSQCLSSLFHPTKVNIGILGNKVAQLHVHIVARYHNDRNWPESIWGTHDSLPFDEKKFQQRFQQIQLYLESIGR